MHKDLDSLFFPSLEEAKSCKKLTASRLENSFQFLTIQGSKISKLSSLRQDLLKEIKRIDAIEEKLMHRFNYGLSIYKRDPNKVVTVGEYMNFFKKK